MEYLYALSKEMDEKVLNIPGVLKTGDPEKRHFPVFVRM